MSKTISLILTLLILILISGCVSSLKSEKNQEESGNDLIVKSYENTLTAAGFETENIENLFDIFLIDQKYNEKYRKYEINGDTLILNLTKVHQRKEGYSKEIIEKLYFKSDTLVCVGQNWNSLGRVSPNTRQIITITVMKYGNNMNKLNKVINEYSLLMFNSTLKTTEIVYDEYGNETVESITRIYNLLEEGFPELIQ